MAAYDGYDYPEFWVGREYEHKSEAICLEQFFMRIGKRQKIVDIGAGYGRLVPLYKKYARAITLAEPSHTLLAKAKSVFAGQRQISYINTTLENLPNKMKEEKFDVAVIVRVMHHIDRPEIALSAAQKVLKPGGYLILEFANKLHGKALAKNIFGGNLFFPFEIFPHDAKTTKHKKDKILFLNHHPDVVLKAVNEAGFKVVEVRSVSNIRSRAIKKLVPVRLLLVVERLLQKPLARLYFGPSIFVLAKKRST